MPKLNIDRRLLSVNPFSRPGKPLAAVKGIVIHWVNNPGITALQTRNYFEGLKSQSLNNPRAVFASAHFIAGLSGEIVQCIPVSEMAYHVGAKSYTSGALSRLGHYPNNCTIGIELCHPDHTGRFSLETWNAAAGLIAGLVAQFNLCPSTDIWTHHAVTRKVCPKYFVEYPEAFEQFKLDVISQGNCPQGVGL
jgi:N-acetylmuramoyl-L-alanine amidase